MNRYNIGIDIGSTTLKAVLVDRESRSVVLNIYQRHQAKVRECLHGCLRAIREQFGEAELSVCLTGSVGMGIAERWSLPFVQEVVAATQYIRIYHPDVSTMIDIGGEDAKMVFFSEGHPSDLRMNGNCAGGTGAFIDQMAILLGVSPEELGALAESATQVYPIASRCGVFCKTDIQNLIARNASRADIAASIFRAVAVQTVTTLAHGHEINAPVLRRAVVLHPGPAESLCRIPRPAAGKPDPARQSQPDTRMGSSLDKKRTDTDRTGSDPADRWKSGTKGTVRSRPPRSHLRQQGRI